MKVIMMLKMLMPAPDMYIMKPFISTVLPGPVAISIALCCPRAGGSSSGSNSNEKGETHFQRAPAPWPTNFRPSSDGD